MICKIPSHSHEVSVDVDSTLGSSLNNDELNHWKHFSFNNGYLLHKGRVYVHLNFNTRCRILYVYHDSPSVGGHPKIWKTYAFVRWKFYLLGLMCMITCCIAKNVRSIRQSALL